jgi:hypothetical protein
MKNCGEKKTSSKGLDDDDDEKKKKLTFRNKMNQSLND